MINSNYLYKILTKIAEKKHYEIKGFSNNYIIEVLNKIKKKSVFIYGNSFPLNNNSSQKICTDKAALYSVLDDKKIPCIEHKIVKNPMFKIGEINKQLSEFLHRYPKGIVVKDNKGSHGKDVFLVKNNKQLKVAVNKIFSKNLDIALSPYVENSCEYRVIMLDNSLCVAYKKIKPSVVGDGKHKVKNLITKAYKNFNFELDKKILSYKPKTNETVTIGWKNNLVFNSTPEIITNSTLKNKLFNLARKVTKTLNLRFCSVDIFETNLGLKVLEVNSIVCMEKFAEASETNYILTKQIFEMALEKSFESINSNLKL